MSSKKWNYKWLLNQTYYDLRSWMGNEGIRDLLREIISLKKQLKEK